MSERSSIPLMELLDNHFTDVRQTLVRTAQDLEGIIERKPDLVFLTVKRVPEHEDSQEMVWITDVLDAHGIAYTGSSQAAHELELYKPLAKQRAIEHGLDTSPFCVVKKEYSFMPDNEVLEYPLFIKPSDRGGGQGVDQFSLVYNRLDAEKKLRDISQSLQADALVEEYLTGREFSVGILKHDFDDAYYVMPLELAISPDQEGSVMSAEVKAGDSEIVTAVPAGAMRDALCELALSIFHALGARDYGRIDMRMNAAGVPQFLEANLMPSVIENYGSLPKTALLNENMDYEALILNIVQLGLNRR